MDEPLKALITRLRAEYLSEMPGRLEELNQAVGRLARKEPGSKDQLTRLFHRLAGSAGAYGFGSVTALCRGAEVELKQGPAVAPDSERMYGVIAAIRAAFEAGPTTEAIAGEDEEGEEDEANGRPPRPR